VKEQLEALVREFGKFADKRGEPWRLEHPELMDAYYAAVEILYPSEWQREIWKFGS
jgi:hypothetical protein